MNAPEVLPTPESAIALAFDPTSTPVPAVLVTPIPAPTAEAVSLPRKVELTGITHTWQKVNNCGPATLAMALSYWGWKGTQANTAAALKPDPNDRNVSPHELAGYARTVGLGAEVRVGGDLERLKQLLAAGFPVVIEKGIVLPDADWEGHYVLISGYSDDANSLITQDSLRGPNFLFPYPLLNGSWRAFNFTYIVLFPPGRQAEVEAALGSDADRTENWRRAADLAWQETTRLSGQDLAFAWLNLGVSRAALGQAEAASALDQARIAGLPWRMLWYQAAVFQAYYAAGRHEEVLALADATLKEAPNIEEAYYWRGRSRLALGHTDDGAADFRQALRYNRNYPEPRQALAEMGLTP